MTRKHFITLPWGTRVRPHQVDVVDVGRVGTHEDPACYFVEVHVQGRVLLSPPSKDETATRQLRDEVARIIEAALDPPKEPTTDQVTDLVFSIVKAAGPWGRTPAEVLDELGDVPVPVAAVESTLRALEISGAVCSSNAMGRREAYRVPHDPRR